MKKSFWTIALVVFLIFLCSIANADKNLSLPYIRQVGDTHDNFNGYCACGATSAVMIAAYHNKLPSHSITCTFCPPAHTSYYGWYVAPYSDGTPVSYTSYGFTFDIGFVGASPCQINPTYGAYGYIHYNDTYAKPFYARNYFWKHGLLSTVIRNPSETDVKNEIDKGHPVWASTNLWPKGHIVVIKGYTSTGYYVADPWPYDGTYCEDGSNRFYTWSQMEVSSKWIVTADPIAPGDRVKTLYNGIRVRECPGVRFSEVASSRSVGDTGTIVSDPTYGCFWNSDDGSRQDYHTWMRIQWDKDGVIGWSAIGNDADNRLGGTSPDDLWIEKTTNGGNNPPNQPTDLWQFKSDGVTGIPVGGMTDESTVVLKGGVSDPDTDDARLQIELRQLNEYGGSFTGTPTHNSGSVRSGSQASITVFGLVNDDYHWRGRTVDSNGATSSWLSAGGNADSAIDFTVLVSDTTPPTAPTISSITHPNENNWYSNNDPQFSWTTPSDASGIAGYSYTIDHSSSTTPNTTVDTTGNSKSYSNRSDGTWYFHVRAKDNAGNWGSTDHYRTKIDTAGPSLGTISINNGASSTNSLIVSLNSLSATDSRSGMGSGAQMKFSNNNSSWSSPLTYSNTYNNWDLSEYGGNTSAGTKTVYVRYKDVAGNWSSSFQDTINYQPDTTPPTPNPMTWATEPYETSTSSIAMVATTASDSSSPVYYYFDYYSSSTGGSGGSDSDWQTSTSYTDSGLQGNHQYSYRVKARDSSSNQNPTSYSSPLSYEYTDIETPSGISFTNITTNSIQAKSSNTPSGLTRGSSGLIIENITKGTDSDWKQNNNFWTSSSLAVNTSYGFRAKAKNGDGDPTNYSPTSYECTKCTIPPTPTISNATSSSLDVNVNPGNNPSYTEFAIYNETGLYYVNASGGNNGSTPIWRTDADWSLVTVTGLSSATTYSFKVKARNGDNTETSFSLAGSGTTSGSSAPKIATIKNQAGDYNLYIYSPPSTGINRSTWVSTDYWTVPGGNNVVAMTAGDFNSDYAGDEIAVIKNQAGDYNLYIYSPPSTGINRSTWVSTDYWTVPGGNNVVAMTAGDFNSDYAGDEIAVIKNQAGDYNLYIYSPPSSGVNRSTWVSTDYWTIPGGNNVVAMTAGDFNTSFSGDEIAVIKNKGGDYNLYIYSPPSTGVNRSTWVSTDYWTVPGGDNIIAIAAGDFNTSFSGDEIAVIKNKGGDYNLYIYSPPSTGVNRSTWVSTDYWTVPGGNNVIAIAGLVLDNSSASIAQAGIPLEIQDLHNYPNPTRDGRTIITYRLNSKPDKVRIEIFNVAGRLIRVIENVPSSSGLNEYLWDGKDRNAEIVANGVYFYRLTAWQGAIEIKKFNKLAVIR